MDEAEEITRALKPPRCPKCGAEIDHLIYNAKELVKASVYLSGDYLEYCSWDTLATDYDTVEYRCPECDEVLFRDENEAKKFLRGVE